MNKVMIPKFLAVALASTLAFGCANNGNKSDQNSSSSTVTEKSTDLEKVGYSIGYATGDSSKQVYADLDLDTFMMGFRDAYSGKEPALTDQQIEDAITNYQEKKQAEMMEKMKQDAVTNKAAGDKFLAENAKKEGVKTTASGLQYKVLKPGTGKPVAGSKTVEINYEGKLLDGTVFDSTYDRGQAAQFPLVGEEVNSIIPGFTEGLKLMKEGDTYELYIPADLAYGETGNVGIEPNSTLIFKIEMIKGDPKMPEQPAQ